MKRIIPSLVLSLLWVYGGCPTADAQQTILLASSQDLKPYSWHENGKPFGIDVDIVREMFKRAGLAVEFDFLPAKRAEYVFSTGEVDGGFSAFKTPEREDAGVFLDLPIRYTTVSIFVKKGEEFEFKELKDLYGKRVGNQRGASVTPAFDLAKEEGRIEVEEVDAPESNLKKLMADRIDALIGNRTAHMYRIKELGLSEEIVALDTPIAPEKGAYLMISEKADIENKPEVLEKLNAALKGMYEDGTIDKITRKYLE